MERKNTNWLVGFCIAIAALLGFVFGFSHGIGKGVEECDKWKDMYDRHINELRLRIEYMDGHTLEPKNKK